MADKGFKKSHPKQDEEGKWQVGILCWILTGESRIDDWVVNVPLEDCLDVDGAYHQISESSDRMRDRQLFQEFYEKELLPAVSAFMETADYKRSQE